MARTVGIGIQNFEKLIMENSFYQTVVGKQRRCDINCPPPQIWKDVEHEHVREISFHRVCRAGRGIYGAVHMGR